MNDSAYSPEELSAIQKVKYPALKSKVFWRIFNNKFVPGPKEGKKRKSLPWQRNFLTE